MTWLKSSQCLLDSYREDVTHPHPGEDSSPSIAVVGFQYRSLFAVVLVHTIHMRNVYLNILGLVQMLGGCISRLAWSPKE